MLSNSKCVDCLSSDISRTRLFLIGEQHTSNGVSLDELHLAENKYLTKCVGIIDVLEEKIKNVNNELIELKSIVSELKNTILL